MFKTWMFLALLTAWVPAFAPAGTTNPFSSTTPSPSTANRPANGSSFNASDGVPNGPEYGTMLHNLSLGPLPCSAAWPYLHRRDMGVCKQLWPPGAPLPQVRCEAVGGYRQIADTFTTLIHGIGMYQTVSSMVDAGAGASRWSGWCVTQTSYEMRKVDSLPPGVPVEEDFVLAKSVSNSQEPDGDADGKDFIFAIVSQGLRRYRVDFRPMVLGAIAALVTDEQCPSCPAEMWHIDLLWTPATLNLYLNLAKGILMEFQPAYTPLASTILRSLKAYSRVEEVTVHGGDHWNASVLVLAELRSLQRVDLAGSGLAELSDENFPRMPNLVHLDLSNNKFSSVPIGIRTLRSLRTLNVSNNPLETMQFAPILRSLQQLEVLNVSRIPLESLDTLILDEGVENLDDNGTMIGDKWRVLDASACNLSDVNSTATRILFRRLRNLHELILADNPLTTVPHDFLVNIRELQVLDLSGCMLTQPPGLRLWPGARLQLLDLSRNALSSPAGALSAQGGGGGGGGGAALLDVSGNPLRGEWGAQAFAALGPRAAVNLSRTELTALTAPMLRALRPLRLVDLGANPIDCATCAIRYLQEWLNTTSADVVSLGRRGPLQCELPPERRGWAVGDARNPPAAQCAGRAVGGGAAWAAGAAVGVALAVGAAAVLLALRFRMLVTYAMHVVRANRAMRSGAGGAGCEFDAFVCYSKHDRPWVMGKLLPRLEGSNPRYRLCLHERDFPLGSLIVQNIVECMARSRHTIMILTPAFVGSQWCQWELEMATHRLLEGAGRDFLVLVELQPLDAKALPRLLRLLVETRTFLQWPSGCAPGGGCGGGAEGAEEAAWRRLRAALGPPIKRSSRHGLSSHASTLTLSLQALDSPAPAPASPPPPETSVAVRSVALVKDKDSFLPEGDIQLSSLT